MHQICCLQIVTFRNFEIAAGDAEGEHWGPPFHDGDMYKWLVFLRMILKDRI